MKLMEKRKVWESWNLTLTNIVEIDCKTKNMVGWIKTSMNSSVNMSVLKPFSYLDFLAKQKKNNFLVCSYCLKSCEQEFMLIWKTSNRSILKVTKTCFRNSTTPYKLNKSKMIVLKINPSLSLLKELVPLLHLFLAKCNNFILWDLSWSFRKYFLLAGKTWKMSWQSAEWSNMNCPPHPFHMSLFDLEPEIKGCFWSSNHSGARN